MYRVDGEKREINNSRQVHFRAFQVWATFRKSSALLYENISYGCEIRKSIKEMIRRRSMGDMLSKTSHKKKAPAIDQKFLKNVSEVLEKARKNAKTAGRTDVR